MTGKLVLENLKNRPLRSLLTILLIGVPVTLILTLVGLTQGMLSDAQNRQRGAGADIMIRGSDAKALTSASGITIPERMVDKVQEQPHVKLAMGVNSAVIAAPSIDTVSPAGRTTVTQSSAYLSGVRIA